tara:strand:+ start:3909 stop:4946 length:1038 start_codon:yes stop_codon:yes gene_type:complete
MNFFVSEMTCLRYFIPLIKEGNRRNVKSTVYWQSSNYGTDRPHKYNCPSKYTDQFKKLSLDFNFDLKKCTEKINNKDLTFLIEGRGRQYFEGKKAALTTGLDFCGEGGNYDKSIENIDYYIFPNEAWTRFSDWPANMDASPNLKPKLLDENEKKNLYLGSPKLDVALNKEEIIKKYNLSNSKKCLIFYPRDRDNHKIDINKISNILENLNYEVLIKYRAKDHCRLSASQNTRIFKDEFWYPHVAMELIYISDIVLNTDSFGLKESVSLKKPILNFRIKPFVSSFSIFNPLNEKFFSEIKMPIDYSLIKERINYLKDAKPEHFQETIDRCSLGPGASKRILDFFGL